MRWLALVFVLLIAALQYPMWLGKGGWLQVRELGRSIGHQHETNVKLKGRNDALDADVRDLKLGSEAIEERARSELGMVRQDEVFFQLQTVPGRAQSAPGAQQKNEPPPGSLRNETVAAPPPARR